MAARFLFLPFAALAGAVGVAVLGLAGTHVVLLRVDR
jgi:hypothetical protein